MSGNSNHIFPRNGLSNNSGRGGASNTNPNPAYNEHEFKELNKVRVRSDQIHQRGTHQQHAYTNLDMEAFREGMDACVEGVFGDAGARGDRLQQMKQHTEQMTKDQKEKFLKECVKQEDKYLRNQTSASTWCTDDFRVVKTLGQGGFGTVRLVQYTQDRQCYAMKQMNKTAFPKKNDLIRLFAERKCLIALEQDQLAQESAYFVKLYGCFQDDQHLYMIMEFLQGGDLISVLCERKRLTETETRFYIGQLIEAIDYIHRCGFVHRDVKPDNICFSKEGHLKLLDFGLCKEITDNHKLTPEFLMKIDGRKVLMDDNDQGITVSDYLRNLEEERRLHLNSWVGTPQYMAPEIVARETYTKSVDFWAAGVVCYDCLVGSTPFNPRVGQGDPPELQKADAVNRVLYKIHRWRAYFQKAIGRGKQANLLRDKSTDFLQSVVAEKEKRLTVSQIRNHKFFEGLNFKKLLHMQPPIVPALASSTDTSKFPKLKETPLPRWTNQRFDIERVRYEAFDFQQNCVPDIDRIAKAVKESTPAFPYILPQHGPKMTMPTLLETNAYSVEDPSKGSVFRMPVVQNMKNRLMGAPPRTGFLKPNLGHAPGMQPHIGA